MCSSALGWVTALVVLVVPRLALAHGGEHHGAAPGGDLAWDLITGSVLGIAAIAYLRGHARLRAGAAGWSHLPAIAYLGGLAVVALALLSPLDARSDIHFSWHIAQHELLVLFSAPLVVLGRPGMVIRAALPPRARATVARAFRTPPLATSLRLLADRWVALLLHGVVVWVWHVPVLFEAALHDDTVHALQHLSMFATAALFWWAMMRGRYGRLGYGIAALFVFLTLLHKGLLAALFAVAGRIFYPTHAVRTELAGGDALSDQSLGGVVMWVPAGILTAALGLGLFVAWLGVLERRDHRGRGAS